MINKRGDKMYFTKFKEFNGRKIKQATMLISDELIFYKPTDKEDLIYEIDYRGDYELCWICLIDKETGKEVYRLSDKNINDIEWE